MSFNEFQRVSRSFNEFQVVSRSLIIVNKFQGGSRKFKDFLIVLIRVVSECFKKFQGVSGSLGDLEE